MKKKIMIVSGYVMILASLSLGLLDASNSNHKPYLNVKSVYSEVLYYNSGNHQIFTGHVENFGNREAYGVTVYVRWSDGQNEYQKSKSIGVMLPKTEEKFQITFDVSNSSTIEWYTQWIEHSNA